MAALPFLGFALFCIVDKYGTPTFVVGHPPTFRQGLSRRAKGVNTLFPAIGPYYIPRMRNCEMRIQGANVQLRTLAHLDVSKTHLHWKRNSEAAHGTEPQCSEPASQSLRLFAIVANDGGSYVGNIKLGPVSARHGIANILVRIGGETYWEEGIATEAIRLATRYAFSYLSLRRLTASASVRDVLAVRAHEEAGFRVEGVRRGQTKVLGIPGQ